VLAETLPFLGERATAGVAVISADGVLYVGALKLDTPCDLPWPERFKPERFSKD
jgi:hypothetical protein